MTFRFISALLSLLLVVVVSGKESKKNIIEPITKDNVQVLFGIQEGNGTTHVTNWDITPGTSLFDAMITEKNLGKLRFTHKMYKIGAYILSIDDIEQDPKKNLFWMLYDCKNILDNTHLRDLNGCILSGTGVSQTYPGNGDIYIYRYQHYNWK